MEFPMKAEDLQNKAGGGFAADGGVKTSRPPMKIEKLYPVYKDYIWGGEKLVNKYGKTPEKLPCAESWELSFHKDGLTKLADGSILQEVADARSLGENVSAMDFFPMLIKFIDAKQNLSVQVHPSDEYALKNENSLGKTEMWYIVDAEENAGIYFGFQRDITEEEYEAAIKNNTLTDLLSFQPVKAGEWYFIPSGTVHAIGAGCLICEIQQNSNLTYRVYDYGRKDANGNTRPLHIEKALKVSSLKKITSAPLKVSVGEGERIGVSKYFTVTKCAVEERKQLIADNKTFKCISCVDGEGAIDGVKFSVGDSLFVPAGYGEFTVTGNATLIISEVRKYYIGIDIGGTFIKGGIVDDTGNIIIEDKIPSSHDEEEIINAIAELCNGMLTAVNLNKSDVVGIGMGVPGMIDERNGEVVYSNNLGWEKFKIAERLHEKTGLPVKISNDANVAALAEVKFGCAKGFKNAVMITLGTGVGSGIIIDGRIYGGNRTAGAELGHSVIVAGGERCTCGRRGCFEAYASATALVRDTKRAMQAHPESKMWEEFTLETADGRTPFSCKDTDAAAKEVVDNYIEKLSCGIINVANEFRPEAIILGGGVCAQGDNLIRPVQEKLNAELFGGKFGPRVEVRIAKLKNSAGLLGGAALLMD